MNLTVTMTGTLEEITLALNAIESNKKRTKEILPIPAILPKISIPVEVKKMGEPRGRPSIPIEIHIGSKESGFALYKIYNSMKLAARSIGCKDGGSINKLVDTGRAYKGMYKFYKHK